MSERASFQQNYLMRYLIMAGICWFGAAWFAYDGFIGYPSKIPAAEAYDQLRSIENTEARYAEWKKLASANGWSDNVPEEKADDIREAITGQYIWMLISMVVGIPAILYYVRCRGSWVEATEVGLKASWGAEVDFSKVTELNKKKWATKGIARATYDEDGASKVFVFDDFKFEREPMGKMLRRLEDQLNPEQIVGGPSEKESEAARIKADSKSQDEPAEELAPGE